MPRSGELPASDLPGLLRQWSDALLSGLDALDQPVAPAARAGSLLLPPAAEEEVAEAEERLGVRLPPSYREFLLCSNGAYGDTMGAMVAGWADAEDEGFLPVSEVRRFIDVEPETVEIWRSVTYELDEAAPLIEGDDVRDHGPMRDALLIARGFDCNCSLLVPVGRPGPDEEWEVWEHHKEGSTRWSSFRAHLHDRVEDHLGVDVDEPEVPLLLARAEQGDLAATQRLGRVRSPGAGALLIEAARREAVPHAVMSALARIGGEEVVAALIDLPADGWARGYVHRALALIGTPEALDHLAEVEAMYQLFRVGDARAAEIAYAHLQDDDISTLLTAVRLLTQLPDPSWVPALLDAYDHQSFDEPRATILGALEACGALEEVRRRAPDLLDGPYAHLGQAMMARLGGGSEPY